MQDGPRTPAVLGHAGLHHSSHSAQSPCRSRAAISRGWMHCACPVSVERPASQHVRGCQSRWGAPDPLPKKLMDEKVIRWPPNHGLRWHIVSPSVESL
eukprot:12387832-Karenia_brevis.AAC.1